MFKLKSVYLKTFLLPALVFCNVVNNLTIVLLPELFLPTISDEFFDIYSSVLSNLVLSSSLSDISSHLLWAKLIV